MSSHENSKEWDKMSPADRLEFTKDAKAKATIMLLQAQEFLQLKQHQKAKEMFINMGDCLSSIKEPDSQVLQLLQLSCSYLSSCYRNMLRSPGSIYPTQKKRNPKRENLLVLKYNKFTGEFDLDEFEESKASKQVRQYVSKINAILFGYQNVQGNHSLIVILTSYWLAFLITTALMVLTLLFITSQTFLSNVTRLEIPSIILGSSLIVPMLMIFLKEPEQRDTMFFQQKLGQQIKLINEECKKRGQPLTFMMPHGGQINIRLDNISSAHNHDDSNPISIQIDPDEEIMNEIKGITKGISHRDKDGSIEESK